MSGNHRKLGGLLVLVAVCALVSSCAAPVPTPTPIPVPTSTPVSTPTPAPQPIDLTILYTSDIIGNTEPCGWGVPLGGIARRASFIKRVTASTLNVLLLDGGNTFWSQVDTTVKSQGKVMAEGMNLLGYQAMALGETDLQLGEAVLRQRMSDAQFPVLSANVVVASTGELLTKPYVILNIGGRKVGIIGLTGTGLIPQDQRVTVPTVAPSPGGQSKPQPAPSPLSGPSAVTPTPSGAKAATSAGYAIGSLLIGDAEAALTKYVAEVQAQTNVVIVISNAGWTANTKLADTAQGIDLIISGGEGQVHYEPWRSALTGAYVAQGAYYPQGHPGQTTAQLDLHFDSVGKITLAAGQLVLLDSSYTDDAAVRNFLNTYPRK